MVIDLYRTNIITRKTSELELIFHCIDIAKVNTWLLYLRHCQQKEVSKKLQMNLRTFTTKIASAFTLAGKDPKRTVGQPRRSISPKPTVRRNPALPSPVADIQLCKVVNWPKIDGNRTHCRKCKMTCTVKCCKCKVGLCLSKERNCFKYFHNLLFVFSDSFLPKNIPQVALIFCHFYYPCTTMLHDYNKLKNWHLKIFFSEPNYFLSSNNTKK